MTIRTSLKSRGTRVLLSMSLLSVLTAFPVGSDKPAHAASRSEYNSAVQTHNANVRAYENDVSYHNSEVARYSRELAPYNRDVSQLKRDNAAYSSDLARHNSAVAAYNRESAAYGREVSWHNSLPPHKRTKFQYDRLVRWKRVLDSRKAQLESNGSSLKSRRARLISRSSWLSSKARSLTSFYNRNKDRGASLAQRKSQINRRKGELDVMQASLSRQSSSGTVASTRRSSSSTRRSTTTTYRRGTTSAGKSGRPTLPGFNLSFVGRGEGKADAVFGPAKSVTGGSFQIDFLARSNGSIPSRSGRWTGRWLNDTTNSANTSYRTQTWEFSSDDLGTATATIRGSATGASGTAYGWVLKDPSNPNGGTVKVKFGVQFSGRSVRLLTFAKSY